MNIGDRLRPKNKYEPRLIITSENSGEVLEFLQATFLGKNCAIYTEFFNEKHGIYTENDGLCGFPVSKIQIAKRQFDYNPDLRGCNPEPPDLAPVSRIEFLSEDIPIAFCYIQQEDTWENSSENNHETLTRECHSSLQIEQAGPHQERLEIFNVKKITWHYGISFRYQILIPS